MGRLVGGHADGAVAVAGLGKDLDIHHGRRDRRTEADAAGGLEHEGAGEVARGDREFDQARVHRSAWCGDDALEDGLVRVEVFAAWIVGGGGAMGQFT